MALTPDQSRQAYPFEPYGPFRSHGELVAAISSPRYTDDPSYRQVVMTKLAGTDRSRWGLAETRQPVNFTKHYRPVEDDGFSW